MFQGFIHPALAAGAFLAAIPLIIHLLNRQRHKPQRWAAMRFVLAAYRKTRRRVQLENLLLLLLRMAVVALLAFAVSRPFTSSESPLAALTESRRDLMLVIDASASTGYREEGQTESLFDLELERARDLIGELDGGRGDRLQLILAGAHPRLLSWTSPEQGLSVLATIATPTDEALDVVATLGRVLELVEKDAAGTGQSTLEVRLLTDMQRNSFVPLGALGQAPLPPSAETGATGSGERSLLMSELLDSLVTYGVRVLVEDFGPKDSMPPNLSIMAVEPAGAIIGPGAPVEIGVVIANRGNAPRAAVRVALEVDGERQPSQRVDLPGRGAGRAVFTVQFSEPGPHALVAVMEGDRLPADDQRAAVVHAPPPVRVLVVNGARATAIEEDETGFLMAVLEPPDDGNVGLGGAGMGAGHSPFDAREITPDLVASPEVNLAEYDLIILANVTDAIFSDASVAELEERVAAGASLLITVGDRITGAGGDFGYNRKLFRSDGSGLLPAEFVRHVAVASREDAHFRVASFVEDHPALSFFADDLWRPILTGVPIYEFLSTKPLTDARVLAQLDDEGSSALLIERPYDQGRVFLWTTTIDPAWTWLPSVPEALVPFLHELVRYAGRRPGIDRNIAPGTPVTIEVASFPRTPELVRPDGTRRLIEGEAAETLRGTWRLPQLGGPDTERAGLYRVELEDGSSEPFAVQLPNTEGNLQRLSAGELSALHPALVVLERSGEQENGGDASDDRRGELWRMLAFACLLALVAESMWGAWLGFKRRVTR